MAKFPVIMLACSCFFTAFNDAADTLIATQTIRDPEVLISNGNRFSLGFFNSGNGSDRYVGVIFNTIKETTVVWVANRDNPLKDQNGTVKISGGNLVISDGRNAEIWSTNVSNPANNCSVQLLNSGNLVLIDDSKGSVIWESFWQASDSWLPNMRLFTDGSTQRSNVLTSWRNPNNPAPGIFTAKIGSLDVPQIYVSNGKSPIWRSGPWNGQIFTGIQSLNATSPFKFGLSSPKPGSIYLTFSHSNQSSLSRFIMNAYGILVLTIWSEEIAGWEVIFNTVENECEAYNKCGPNGICEAGRHPVCHCLPGFKPQVDDEWNKGNFTSGCSRKTILHCPTNTSVDGFKKLQKVKVPDKFMFMNINKDHESNCREMCLIYCACTAYSFSPDIGCLLWNESLIDLQQLTINGCDLYLRLAHSELDSGKKKAPKPVIASLSVIGFIFFVVSMFCLWKRLSKQKGRKLKQEINEGSSPIQTETSMFKADMQGVMYEDLNLFDFQTITIATKQFDSSNKLGQGGFGPVYKGTLPNGQEIAVKRLGKSSNQGKTEFVNEVQVISKLQHRNLVRILGCCIEWEENMLVYEFMPNGSLDTYIFDSSKQGFIDWKQRAKIIEGICRGLLYLHRDSRLKIIHRDLKASNILLDEEMNPKISDFGTARIFGGKEDQVNTTTRVVGTYGYMAPEYVLQGRFSEKTDVYSFGVLLLEIVSGLKNNSFYNEEHELTLISYAWKLWKEDNIYGLTQTMIHDSSREKEMIRYVQVGLLCLQELAKDRPTISTVLSMLSNEIVELPNPNKPAFTVDQSPMVGESSDQFSSKSASNNVTLTVIEGR